MKQLTFLIFILFNSHSFAQSSDYPGRNIYSQVEVYETEQLNNEFNNVNIIDTRSNYEFNVLHINGSINIPIDSKTFTSQLSDLSTDNKPIIFYCNGHTCYKSYKAVLKAKKAGIANVYSYDSGVFDWANAYPEKTTMLNVTPINPQNIISKQTLSDHSLSPQEFHNKITDDSIILDIRDKAQRGLLSLFPYRQKNISLQQSDKLASLFDSIKAQNKPLFIYDAAGKQVRWLQYYIEAKGIKDYYFMEGGFKNSLAR